MRIKLGYRKDGTAVFSTDAEIIQNALNQEKEGVEPHYSFYNYVKKEPVTPPGWLVWSLWKGCGVVYRREDGKMIICEGVQGDFSYV